MTLVDYISHTKGTWKKSQPGTHLWVDDLLGSVPVGRSAEMFGEPLNNLDVVRAVF